MTASDSTGDSSQGMLLPLDATLFHLGVTQSSSDPRLLPYGWVLTPPLHQITQAPDSIGSLSFTCKMIQKGRPYLQTLSNAIQ